MSELPKLSDIHFRSHRGKDNYVHCAFYLQEGPKRTQKMFKLTDKNRFDADMMTVVNYLKKYHYADDIWGLRGHVSQYFTQGTISIELYSIISAGIEKNLLPKNIQVNHLTPITVPIYTQYGRFNSENLDLTHYPSIEKICYFPMSKARDDNDTHYLFIRVDKSDKVKYGFSRFGRDYKIMIQRTNSNGDLVCLRVVKYLGGSHYNIDHNYEVVDFENLDEAIKFCQLFIWTQQDVQYMHDNRQTFGIIPPFPESLDKYAMLWLNYKFVHVLKDRLESSCVVIDGLDVWSCHLEERKTRFNKLYSSISPDLSPGSIEVVTLMTDEDVPKSIRIFSSGYIKFNEQKHIRRVIRTCNRIAPGASLKVMVINNRVVIIICASEDVKSRILSQWHSSSKPNLLCYDNSITFNKITVGRTEYLEKLVKYIKDNIGDTNLTELKTTIVFQLPDDCKMLEVMQLRKVPVPKFIVQSFEELYLEQIRLLEKGDTLKLLYFKFKPSVELMKAIIDALNRGACVTMLLCGSNIYSQRSRTHLDQLYNLKNCEIINTYPNAQNWNDSNQTSITHLKVCIIQKADKVKTIYVGSCNMSTSGFGLSADHQDANGRQPNIESTVSLLPHQLKPFNECCEWLLKFYRRYGHKYYYTSDGAYKDIDKCTSTEEAAADLEEDPNAMTQEWNEIVANLKENGIYYFEQKQPNMSTTIVINSSAKDMLARSYACKESYFVATMVVTPPYTEILIELQARGVFVFVVVSQLSNSRYTKYLRDNGVPVLVVKDFLHHTKAILMDGKFLFIGSANATIHALFVNGGEFYTLFDKEKKLIGDNEEYSFFCHERSCNNIIAMLFYFQVMLYIALEDEEYYEMMNDDSSDSDNSLSSVEYSP